MKDINCQEVLIHNSDVFIWALIALFVKVFISLSLV